MDLLTKEKFTQLKHTNSTILDKVELEKQGFGGIIAVGKGSIYDPYLAIFEYNPPSAKETNVLIGKGVTFDTGGYSIKSKKVMLIYKKHLLITRFCWNSNNL